MIRFSKERFYTSPGSSIHKIYAPKVSKDGSVQLVESGVENTDDYIQSFEQSVDINVILSRIQAGETDLLFARPGSYGDFTKMPQTYAEALQLQIDATNLFNSLPADVRSKFDNDSSKFFSSAGSLDWFKQIESVLPDEVKHAIFPDGVPEPAPVKEVDIDES